MNDREWFNKIEQLRRSRGELADMDTMVELGAYRTKRGDEFRTTSLRLASKGRDSDTESEDVSEDEDEDEGVSKEGGERLFCRMQ